MRAQIGSYRIEHVLGQGGMGVVYKGRHDRLGRSAAIKMLPPTNAADTELRKRFLAEAQAQARLQHRNVVTVYDLIDEGGELFIAMEYVEGETLAAMLDRRPEGRMPLDEAQGLFEQVLEALEYVHQQAIIHRDVKPSNIIVCDGCVKLADFGLALLAGAPRLTVAQHVVGTRSYMSPEQLQGKALDGRSDLYSAALVLYRMVSGHAAFTGKDYLAQMAERIAGPPELRSLVPDIPAGIEAAIAIELRVDPDERFPTALAFRDALREGSHGFIPSLPPPSDAPTVVMETEAAEPVAEATTSRGGAVVAWAMIAGSLTAGTYGVVNRLNRASFPAEAPASIARATSVPLPDPVTPPAPISVSPPAPPPSTPKTLQPIPAAVPEQHIDHEAEREKRQRELAALHDEIRRGFEEVEAALRGQKYDAAMQQLDAIAAKAAQGDDTFGPEHAQLAELRARAVEQQVAAATQKQQDAMWQGRLAEVEEDIRNEKYLEAQRYAQNIANDAKAPPSVAARARELAQQAKDAFIHTFQNGTQLGPTTNTIRKPSSPPRKND